MDIDKFIDDNIEEILDNPSFFISKEQTTKENKAINKNIYEDEDLEEDDIIDLQDVHEMLERKKEAEKNKENDNLENTNEDPEYYFKFINTYMIYYNNKYNKKETEKNKENDNLENTNEDPEYYFKFINTYMIYYNNKYNKKENLFSNIENKEKDTNSALELFFEAIMEFKDLKEKLNIDEIDLLDKYYDSESNEIINLMNSYEQVYCLEINENKKKIITISLIICLNYILVNKIEKWNIFMLKNY